MSWVIPALFIIINQTDMKITIDLDLVTGEGRILSITDPTKDDIINLITDYFKVSKRELLQEPLYRGDDFVKCRRFISYYLKKLIQGITNQEIAGILHYSGQDSGIISYNISEIEKGIADNDPIYTRTYDNLEKLFKLFKTKR